MFKSSLAQWHAMVLHAAAFGISAKITVLELTMTTKAC
jgi:hypothetical protein